MSPRGADAGSHDELPEFEPRPVEASSYEMERIAARLFKEASPHRIGRFTVRRRIGAGGQGKVFQAYDDFLEREVAIKVLANRSEVTDRAYMRLGQEAQALATLDHPNIVGVFEANVDRGELYLAMEYLEGENLHDWLWSAEAGRSLAEVLAAFLQAARGLHASHKAGLLHRDFKPGNVMIDASGQVRLIDFGLVKPFDAQADEGTPAEPHAQVDTELGAYLGTRPYMSPEQLDRNTRTLTPASDQFSFAVSLFEALYGERPFRKNDLPTLKATLSSDAWQSPPSTRSVPKWLHRILERALSPEPECRFPDMGALIDAIENRSQRNSRLRRKASLITVGLALGLTVVAAIVVWPDRCAGTREEASAALRAEKPSGIEPELSQELDEYAERLATALETTCRMPNSTKAEREYVKSREDCLTRLSDEYLAYTAALLTNPQPAWAYLDHFGGDPKSALRLPSPKSCESPQEQPTRTTARHLVRRILALRSATNTGQLHLDEADKLVDAAQASDERGLLAEALYERGRIAYFYRYNELSYEDFAAASDAAQSAGRRELEVDARIFAALSAMLADQSEEVIDFRLTQATAQVNAMTDEGQLERMSFLYTVDGRIANLRGDHELAIDLIQAGQDAYRDSKRGYSERARQLQDVSLAGVLAAQGAYADADELLDVLVTSFRPSELPDLVWGHIYLVRAQTLQAWTTENANAGEARDLASEARSAFALAHKHFRLAFGDAGAFTAKIEFDLAKLAYDLGDLPDAEAHIREAHKLQRQLAPRERTQREYAETLVWLATIRMSRAKDSPTSPEGEQFYQEMLALLEEAAASLPKSAQAHPIFVHILRQKAALLDWLDQPYEAIRAYDRLLCALPADEEYASSRERRDRLIRQSSPTSNTPSTRTH